MSTTSSLISAGFSRRSIPTQLRDAGHTLESHTDPVGRIVYVVDGTEMDLRQAADLHLGGWDNAFGAR